MTIIMLYEGFIAAGIAGRLSPAENTPTDKPVPLSSDLRSKIVKNSTHLPLAPFNPLPCLPQRSRDGQAR